MNQDMVMSFIRQILMFGGGVLVSTGWLDSETMLALAGALATIIGTFWSIFHHKGLNKVDALAVVKNVATPQQSAAVAMTPTPTPKTP